MASSYTTPPGVDLAIGGAEARPERCIWTISSGAPGARCTDLRRRRIALNNSLFAHSGDASSSYLQDA